MERDPALVFALQEIDEILKRYSLGGYVVVVSQSHGAAKLTFPSWSTVQFSDDKRAMIFNTEAFDDNTIHLVDSMRNALGEAFITLESTSERAYRLMGLDEHRAIDEDSKKSVS